MNDYQEADDFYFRDAQMRQQQSEVFSAKEENLDDLPQMASIQSEFSFKNPLIVRVGKIEREETTVLKTVSEPMPCQESEEDYMPTDERSIFFKEVPDGDGSNTGVSGEDGLLNGETFEQ